MKQVYSARQIARTNEKSTPMIAGTINEVLRAWMSHNDIHTSTIIMPHPSSFFKLLHIISVTDVLFLCLFRGKIAKSVKLKKVSKEHINESIN